VDTKRAFSAHRHTTRALTSHQAEAVICTSGLTEAATLRQGRLQLRANGGRNYAPPEAAIMRERRHSRASECLVKICVRL